MEGKITLELTHAQALMIRDMTQKINYDYHWMEAIKESLYTEVRKACPKKHMPTNMYKRKLKEVRKRYQGEVVEEEMVQAEANELRFFFEVQEGCYIEEECEEPGGILYSIVELTDWISDMVKKNKDWHGSKCFNNHFKVISGPDAEGIELQDNICELAKILGASLTCQGRTDGKEELSFTYRGCKVFQIREELSFERLLSDIT